MPDGSISLPYCYEPRPYQVPTLKALDDGCKRAIQVWHRRSGKDKTDIAYTACAMLDRVGTYFYIYPSYTQAKKAIWDGRDRDGFPFLGHFPKELITAKHEQELKLTYRNGSIFQLIGSDNIDSIMSTNPVGVVFAEYSLQDPKAWDYVRPILRENGGWAIFNFTPRGKNHAWELLNMARGNPDWHVSVLTVDDTQALSKADIDAERREGMDEDLVQQEYYCSFEGVLQGAYYGKQIAEAEKDGRIGNVPYERNIGVETWWDIGVGDTTSIWFTQSVGREVLCIDYLEASGESVAYYAKELQAKPYTYLSHNGPHDLSVREWGNSDAIDNRPVTRLDSAKAQGIDFRVVPKVSLESGIDTARSFFARCRFDRTNCRRGLDALASYCKEYDEKMKQFRSYPAHDWSSHAADAFRYLAVGHRTTEKPRKEVDPFMIHGAARSAQTGWMAR